MKRVDTYRRRLLAACTVAFLLSACGMLLLAGCDPAEPSAAERTDRASRHYTAAMAELQAGHIETAIKGFEEVVRAEPGNGNAHFQLAALLEDIKKDYLGAIVHYRLYLTIRPQSDKTAVAQDRMAPDRRRDEDARRDVARGAGRRRAGDAPARAQERHAPSEQGDRPRRIDQQEI